jgi:hypothetical protein
MPEGIPRYESRVFPQALAPWAAFLRRFAVKTDSHRSLDGCGKATLIGVRLASGGNAGVMMRVMAVLLVVMFVMVMTLSCQ